MFVEREAIRIASELSTVQGDLERATGEAAYQTKRVTTDVVTLSLAVAYIVPWLFVVVPGLYLLRFLWRRRGR